MTKQDGASNDTQPFRWRNAAAALKLKSSIYRSALKMPQTPRRANWLLGVASVRCSSEHVCLCWRFEVHDALYARYYPEVAKHGC